MMMLVIEGRTLKRKSKKLKERYYRLEPGETWFITSDNGQRVAIASDRNNTQTIYVGGKYNENQS